MTTPVPLFNHFLPSDWNGIAPFFPLADVALLPQGLLPLHIFEPRYRAMTADALAGNQLLAIATVQPGWIPNGLPPAVLPVMGVGKIVAHEQTLDGRYYIVLKGLARVRLQEEQPPTKLYRLGEFEVLEPILQLSDSEMTQLTNGLIQSFELAFGQSEKHVPVLELLNQRPPLSELCDVISAALSIRAAVTQKLLEAVELHDRCRLVHELLQSVIQASQPNNKVDRPFPPGFSPN